MRNLPALVVFLSFYAPSLCLPMSNTRATALSSQSQNPRAIQRAAAASPSYPQYYYSNPTQNSGALPRRQDEILETAQRVVYTPIFRYKKNQRQRKRQSQPNTNRRKVNRVMPAYLITAK
ncbi:hypothetical protein NQ315_001225 [Exocentrus adspersus]|uniref:Uncharacterized protein n=1 Tax=Exocentrus adspersus TaxID=1586481 RepID=A0AAV8WES9_9CUCU|nr:hypothetical protein NQ315_001225 [Exocentrus adspersus]